MVTCWMPLCRLFSPLPRSQLIMAGTSGRRNLFTIKSRMEIGFLETFFRFATENSVQWQSIKWATRNENPRDMKWIPSCWHDSKFKIRSKPRLTKRNALMSNGKKTKKTEYRSFAKKENFLAENLYHTLTQTRPKWIYSVVHCNEHWNGRIVMWFDQLNCG